jgi:hypothetical protein
MLEQVTGRWLLGEGVPDPNSFPPKEKKKPAFFQEDATCRISQKVII